MSSKVAATFHSAEPDPQTAQQLAVARAYVARVNECPYQHTHTSLYCSKCGWFAESPIPALVAEVDRLVDANPPALILSNELAAEARDDGGVWLPAGRFVRTDLEGQEQHSRAKRFSDVEMAAELFRQVFQEAESEVRGRKSGDPRWIPIQREECLRSVVVERFATLPHHDAAQRQNN